VPLPSTRLYLLRLLAWFDFYLRKICAEQLLYPLMYLVIKRVIPFLVLSIFILVYFLGLGLHQWLLTLTRFLL
jgi:hypothetical protein